MGVIIAGAPPFGSMLGPLIFGSREHIGALIFGSREQFGALIFGSREYLGTPDFWQ